MHLIDIHTHHPASEAATFALLNVLSGFDQVPAQGWYSVGLHPWHLLSGDGETVPATLLEAAHLPNVLAIGECGLDTRCVTPMDLQRRCFVQQIGLARDVGKPLIIHCVRAFEEVLLILRKQQVSVPVIFHGFRQGEAVAQRILGEGHRISFGRHLMNQKVAAVFRALPAERVFLETDDGDVPISSVYAAAAACRGMDIGMLADQIRSNLISDFGPQLTAYV